MFLSNMRQPNQPFTWPLAPEVQANMLVMYLQGRTVEDIRRISGKWSLGQVVHAAVEGDWEGRRRTYLANLLDDAQNAAKQAVAESAKFIAESMAAAHKLHGDNIAKFMLSGNPDDLGKWDVTNIAQYQRLVETLMRVTGQDQVRKVTVGGTLEHRVQQLPSAPPPPVDAKKTLAEWSTRERDKRKAKLNRG